MKRLNNLVIACDGESASGKSTAAKLISKKYKLLLINSGLIYRYCSKLRLKHKPKKIIPFLKEDSKIFHTKQFLNKNFIQNILAMMLHYWQKKKSKRYC